ncbi:MAG: uracil-DNA glycosylase [Chloroflexi bacterium]|nr:uracil-DNA glycosylase [Chloroflexota bacterium]
MSKDATSELAALYREIALCERCSLAKSRLKVVPGDGPATAEIVFIGEAPGWHENQQGLPFVGPAGQFLDELLASIGLKRNNVYITNVIKCRPLNNRDPLPVEMEACAPFLQRQLELIGPRMVVTLGRYSMAKYFPGQSISRVHGRPSKRGGVVYLPMYHPAAALHQPSLRRIVETDMLKIPSILAEAKQMPDEGEEERTAEQLTLF